MSTDSVKWRRALWSVAAEGAPATGDAALRDARKTAGVNRSKRCRHFALPPHSKKCHLFFKHQWRILAKTATAQPTSFSQKIT